MCCAASFICPRGPVVEAHHALDNAKVCSRRSANEQFHEHIVVHEPGIQVPRRATRDNSVVSGINEIRSGLKWLDTQPAFGKRAHHSQGDSGLSDSAMCPGYDEARERP